MMVVLVVVKVLEMMVVLVMVMVVVMVAMVLVLVVPLTLSPCHPVTLSPCHPSPCHLSPVQGAWGKYYYGGLASALASFVSFILTSSSFSSSPDASPGS